MSLHPVILNRKPIPNTMISHRFPYRNASSCLQDATWLPRRGWGSGRATGPYTSFVKGLSVKLGGFRGRLKWKEGKGRVGGLGSSHTAPFGAAVPARPPTRSWHVTRASCSAQWFAGAIVQGTRVLVPGTSFGGRHSFPRSHGTHGESIRYKESSGLPGNA